MEVMPVNEDIILRLDLPGGKLAGPPRTMSRRGSDRTMAREASGSCCSTAMWLEPRRLRLKSSRQAARLRRMASITFYGAAGTVTGSRFLLEHERKKASREAA